MTLLIKDLADKLKEVYEVHVLAVKGEQHEPVLVDGITYYSGHHTYASSDYEHIIAHPPYNIRSNISLYDSVKYVGGEFDPNNLENDLVIFTTNHIKNTYSYARKSIVMHPPVFPERHRTHRGSNITLIGMSERKGVRVAIRLSKMNPDIKFLGVKSGWSRREYIPFKSRNFSVIDEVEDMRQIWNQTAILISPSREEQYGKASLEAMASGIPVIAYECPGVREALGAGALILDTLDPIQWDIALKDVYKHYDYYSRKALKQSAMIDSHKELDNVLEAIRWI